MVQKMVNIMEAAESLRMLPVVHGPSALGLVRILPMLGHIQSQSTKKNLEIMGDNKVS